MKHRTGIKALNLLLSLALVLTFIPFMGTSADADTDEVITKIYDSDDWVDFANTVNSGQEGCQYEGKKVELMNDITVNGLMVGTEGSKFKGTFEGHGNTLTVNYTTEEKYTAPFRYVDGAKFYDLKVNGTINTSEQFAAGLVASSSGDTIIDCCYSSVTINSSVTGQEGSGSGDGTHGGFIAFLESRGKDKNPWTVIIKDSLFDGTITGETTANCGGFVGWPTYNKIIFKNCVNNGTFSTDQSGCATFSRIGVGRDGTVYNDRVTITNCYYKTAYGVDSLNADQGNAIGDMTAEQLRDALRSGSAHPEKDEFWIVSGGNVVPSPFRVPATVTKKPVAKKLTYNGKAQKLVKAGTASGGVMMYALSGESKTAPESGWKTSIPTGKKAGLYYVWYKVANDEYHLASDISCVTVKIAKPSNCIKKVIANKKIKKAIKKKDPKAINKAIKEREALEESESDPQAESEAAPASDDSVSSELNPHYTLVDLITKPIEKIITRVKFSC